MVNRNTVMRQIKRILFSLFMTMSVEAAVASPWPTGVTDRVEVVTGQTIKINILDNDLGEGLFVKSANESSITWGRISISEDKKSVTYTPNYDYEGFDSFWYVLEDAEGRTNAAEVNIYVSKVAWSKANNDTAKAAYTGVFGIPVLDNDEGTELKVVSVNEWSTNKGKVWIDVDGKVKYQQVGEPRGEQIDEFWYVTEDKWGRKNAAKVTVALSESFSGEWPTANPDVAVAKNGLKAMIPVLDNDIGFGLKLKETDIGTEKGGHTAIVDRVIRYSPPKGFTGTDAFWYVFEDSLGRLNSARVEVEVTQNTKLSVVEFCGNTYETDGTVENTNLTNRIPVPTENRYVSLGSPDFGNRGGYIDGRRYYREGSLETGFSLWIDFDGMIAKVEESSAGENLYFVGAYNNHAYYAQGRHLYAHDGYESVDLGNRFEGIVDSSNEDQEGVIRSVARGNALYITAEISAPAPFVSKRNDWRISDGLDLNLFWRGNVNLWLSDVSSPRAIRRDISQLTYFNGYGYRFNHSHNDSTEYWYQNYTVDQIDGEVLAEIAYGAAGEIIENNDRLFIVTEPFSVDREGLYTTPGKLYVIDNYNESDSFVELAVCGDDEVMD